MWRWRKRRIVGVFGYRFKFGEGDEFVGERDERERERGEREKERREK